MRLYIWLIFNSDHCLIFIKPFYKDSELEVLAEFCQITNKTSFYLIQKNIIFMLMNSSHLLNFVKLMPYYFIMIFLLRPKRPIACQSQMEKSQSSKTDRSKYDRQPLHKLTVTN